VFTSEECDTIIKKAETRLEPSIMDTDGHTDKTVRDSETAWIGPDENGVAKKMIKKCVSYTDRKPVNSEQLQVLKYKEGGFYKPHQDAWTDEPNPRTVTAIIALNDDYEGGETEFPNLGKKFKLNKGDVLLFNNFTDWGYQTPKSLHGGRPVKSGVKWICNLWIHRYPYNPEDWTGSKTFPGNEGGGSCSVF
jgi:prolyl 4-hydroxylase